MFNRGALVGFGLALAEVLTFVLVVRAFGVAFVVLGSVALLFVGLVVLRRQLPALLSSGRDLLGGTSLFGGLTGFGLDGSDADGTDDVDSGEAEALRATDRALATLGGVLLIVPGFITAAAGVVLLLPPSRALLRGFARRRFAQFVPRGLVTPFPVDGFAPPGRGFSGSDVIDVDVVSEDMPRTAPRELS